MVHRRNRIMKPTRQKHMYTAKEVRCVLLLMGANSEFNVGQEQQ